MPGICCSVFTIVEAPLHQLVIVSRHAYAIILLDLGYATGLFVTAVFPFLLVFSAYETVVDEKLYLCHTRCDRRTYHFEF